MSTRNFTPWLPRISTSRTKNVVNEDFMSVQDSMACCFVEMSFRASLCSLPSGWSMVFVLLSASSILMSKIPRGNYSSNCSLQIQIKHNYWQAAKDQLKQPRSWTSYTKHARKSKTTPTAPSAGSRRYEETPRPNGISRRQPSIFQERERAYKVEQRSHHLDLHRRRTHCHNRNNHYSPPLPLHLEPQKEREEISRQWPQPPRLT